MKKITWAILTVLTLAFVALVGNSYAAGTCGYPTTERYTGMDNDDPYKLKWSYVSSVAGTADCTAVEVHGYVVKAVVNPTDAHTADWDITVKDSDGVDVMGGVLVDLNTTASEQQIPQINSLNVPVRVDDSLTPQITNAGNAKSGTLELTIQP